MQPTLMLVNGRWQFGSFLLDATPTEFQIRYGATTPFALTPDGRAVFALGSIELNAGEYIRFGAGTRSYLRSPANGQLNINNNTENAGIGLDVTTDGTLKIRNRAQNADGNLSVGNVTSVGGFATTGIGVPIIVANARTVGATAAVASVATYTPTTDGTFEVSANVLVTTATTHSFNIECAYTDEGNTARILTFLFTWGDTATIVSAVDNVRGAVPYMGIPQLIRAKANTSITIRTQAAGTYTTVTYNVEGLIKRIS